MICHGVWSFSATVQTYTFKLNEKLLQLFHWELLDHQFHNDEEVEVVANLRAQFLLRQNFYTHSSVGQCISVFVDYLFFVWCCSLTLARAASCLRFLDLTHWHTTVSRTLWTRDRPVVETSIWQHTTLTRDRHPCPWQDSSPQSQQVIGVIPSPYTALPLGLVFGDFGGKQWYLSGINELHLIWWLHEHCSWYTSVMGMLYVAVHHIVTGVFHTVHSIVWPHLGADTWAAPTTIIATTTATTAATTTTTTTNYTS